MRFRPTGPVFGLTLRGILVITTLLAVGIALVGTKVKRARYEKAIARAILAAGGSLRYAHHGNAGAPAQEERTWFERLVDLDLESHLVAVILSGPNVTDATVSLLVGLPHLGTISLADTKVTGAGLSALARLPALVSLRVDGHQSAPLTDDILAVIATLPHVQHLGLRSDAPGASTHKSTGWSENALVSLSEMPELIGLTIEGKGFTDELFRNLRPLPKVIILSVTNTSVSDDSLRAIAIAMPQLEALVLSHNNINGSGLHYFSSCPRLSNLAIWQCPLTNDGVADIGALQQVTTLQVNRGTLLGDPGLEHICALTNLTRLQLVGDRFTDAGTRHLTNLKSLTWLSLDSANGKLTDARPFEALSDLKYLDTGGAGLPRVEADRLIKALPGLSLHPAPIP